MRFAHGLRERPDDLRRGGAPGGGSTPLARDVTVIPGDTGPIFEGGPLDVVTDCPFPTVCEPNDPGYVYKCGQRIYQCSSLEQCENTCQGDDCGAQCVNPCMDTLGQNTSNGCEFFPIEIDTANEVAGACFAVFIINQWNTGQPARIQVDQGGTILPIEQFARIPVGQGREHHLPAVRLDGRARAKSGRHPLLVEGPRGAERPDYQRPARPRELPPRCDPGCRGRRRAPRHGDRARHFISRRTFRWSPTRCSRTAAAARA